MQKCVIPFYNSNQPSLVKVTNYPTEPEENENIFDLNFDCLYYIFSYLGLNDLYNVKDTCQLFEQLSKLAYKKYKTVNLNHLNHGRRLSLTDIKQIFKQIGPYIQNLKISSDNLSVPTTSLLVILEYCKNLQNLSLNNFTINFINFLELPKFQNCYKNLNILELVGCDLTEAKLGQLLCLGSNLSKLNVSYNNELTGEFLLKLYDLEGLNLNYCTNIQPHNFTEFLKNNQSLKYLYINRVKYLTDNNIRDIVNNLINLDELIISNKYNYLSDSDIKKLANLRNLKKLRIINIGLASYDADILFTELARVNQLEYFEGTITTAGLLYLPYLTKLKYLKFNSCPHLTDNILNLVAKNNLEVLHLHICYNVTNNGLSQFVKNCPNLKWLNISACPEINVIFLKDLNDMRCNHKLQINCDFVHRYDILNFKNLQVNFVRPIFRVESDFFDGEFKRKMYL